MPSASAARRPAHPDTCARYDDSPLDTERRYRGTNRPGLDGGYRRDTCEPVGVGVIVVPACGPVRRGESLYAAVDVRDPSAPKLLATGGEAHVERIARTLVNGDATFAREWRRRDRRNRRMSVASA